MHCPFCASEDTQVKDSRPSEDNSAIRRRRACPSCGARFTTFERVQLREMTVIKSDRRKQPFDRDKMVRSLQVALRKRPVEVEEIEKAANEIVRQLESGGDPEVTTAQIGEHVMKALARLDSVAYIRFASVYHDFTQPEDFTALLRELKKLQPREAAE
jgi:transcriptional repressor NrdR